jgi:hypothetical protein
VDVEGCRAHAGSGGDVSGGGGLEAAFGEGVDGAGEEPPGGGRLDVLPDVGAGDCGHVDSLP